MNGMETITATATRHHFTFIRENSSISSIQRADRCWKESGLDWVLFGICSGPTRSRPEADPNKTRSGPEQNPKRTRTNADRDPNLS